MRILQAIQTLSVGGAQRLLAGLVTNLRRRGHDVGVVVQYERGGYIQAELESRGVELHFLGKRPGLDVRMVPRMARVVASFRPDIFHSHNAHVLRYALPAVALTRRCPVVHTLHTLAEHESDTPGKILQFFAFRAGVAAVAIGQRAADSVRRVYGVAPRRIIPNGIAVEDFAPPPGSKAAIRAELGVPPNVPTFVSVGRLVPLKNHAGLLDALASQRLRSLGAHLLLAGDGELRSALEQHARALGIAASVHFLGTREDIPRILHAADVFVLASQYEGNPLSIMEAMAAERPVVATAVGSVPELVTGEAGRLVAPGDTAALESAMFQFASDLPRARAAGGKAVRIARERFDLSVTARAYEVLYEELAR